jgi:hypothetical protein
MPDTDKKLRIPPVRDVTPKEFAKGIVTATNRWLIANGHPPLRKKSDDSAAPPPGDETPQE